MFKFLQFKMYASTAQLLKLSFPGIHATLNPLYNSRFEAYLSTKL